MIRFSRKKIVTLSDWIVKSRHAKNVVRAQKLKLQSRVGKRGYDWASVRERIDHGSFSPVLVICSLLCGFRSFIGFSIALLLNSCLVSSVLLIYWLPLFGLLCHPLWSSLRLFLCFLTLTLLVSPNVSFFRFKVIVWFRATTANTTTLLLASHGWTHVISTALVIICTNAIIDIASSAEICLNHLIKFFRGTLLSCLQQNVRNTFVLFT